MTDEKVLEVVDGYREILLKRGNVRVRNFEVPNENHLLWMCDQFRDFLREGRREKAMRWLGFIQGAFWVLGLRSVEEMKNDNKPPSRVYYFGCWNSTGHYLYAPGGAAVRECQPEWFTTHGERRNVDATLAPRRFKNSSVLTFYAEHPLEAHYRIESKTVECPQGEFLLHHLDNGFTALSWWDRTQGDTRGACNSTILLEGEHDVAAMLAALSKHFPHVVNNLTKVGVRLVDATERRHPAGVPVVKRSSP